MAQDFDPHILATMTEEERASIQEEQSPEEKAAIVAIDTGSENGPNEDDEDDEDDEGADPAIAAQVPGSDGPGDVDGNEFSDVDRLTGDTQEAAIAKMSAAQRDRYMAGV